MRLAILKSLFLTILLVIPARDVVNVKIASGPQNLAAAAHQAQSLLEPAPRLGWSGPSYNAHRQRCRHTGPETATTAYGYDGAGNLAWKAEGLAQTTGCPAAGSADKHFSYYDNGRLETATRSAAGSQPASTWTLQWYQRGLLKSETLAIDGHGFALAYGYNSEGHRASLTYPGGRTIQYAPNGRGQPTRLGSYATSIHYAPNGQPKTYAYGNGVQALYTYNTRQLRRQTTYSLSGNPLADRTLEYDPNGNLTAINDTTSGAGCAVADTIFCNRFEAGGSSGPGSRSFVYDELNRLLEVVNPLRQDQFSYDPLGNLRTSSELGTWHYDARNRIDERIDGGTTYPHTWDGRGNLTDDGQRSYTWNRANELTADGDGGQYAYDARGWRVRVKRGSSQPVYSVYDHQQRLVVRLDAQTSTQTDFVHLGPRPIARIEGGQTTYIHPDYQNSPLLETNAAGTITRQPVYLGYGQTDSEGMSEIPGYTGAAMDTATGQTYLGARYLHQNRFTSPDPAALDPTRPAGLNRFAYANNNPYKFADPDGRNAVLFIGGLATETWNAMTGRGFDGTMVMGALKDGYDGQGSGFAAAAFQDATSLIPAGAVAGAAIKASRIVTRASKVARGAAQSSANAARLNRQLSAQEIAGGHAFSKHASEFANLGIRNQQQFARHIEGVMSNPSATRQLRGGRTAFWDDATGTVVIRNPAAREGGTAFRPTRGRDYFEGLR